MAIDSATQELLDEAWQAGYERGEFDGAARILGTANWIIRKYWEHAILTVMDLPEGAQIPPTPTIEDVLGLERKAENSNLSE